jgi:hypothetical protein
MNINKCVEAHHGLTIGVQTGADKHSLWSDQFSGGAQKYLLMSGGVP